MRILDEEKSKGLERITLYLTASEASEMRDSLNAIIAAPVGRHEHIPSDDYRKEVTLCIYESGALEQFDDRSRKLIIEDA